MTQHIYRANHQARTIPRERPERIIPFSEVWSDQEMLSMNAWPDTRAGLAAEDRDLLAEARDTDACLATAASYLLHVHPSTVHPNGKTVHSLAN